jgi:hypothetical protein
MAFRKQAFGSHLLHAAEAYAPGSRCSGGREGTAGLLHERAIP